MESLTANEAKTHFGNLLMKAQEEPVQISRNGTPVAVLMSSADYDAIEQVKLDNLRLRAAAARHEENLIDGPDFFKRLRAGEYLEKSKKV